MCTLDLLPETYTVFRLPPDTPFQPEEARGDGLWAFVRTADEVSIVCAHREGVKNYPGTTRAERGWRALKVRGPLDFSQVGILASIAGPLANAGVSIFTISTFDTDYILVKDNVLDQAQAALEKAGHRVSTGHA